MSGNSVFTWMSDVLPHPAGGLQQLTHIQVFLAISQILAYTLTAKW